MMPKRLGSRKIATPTGLMLTRDELKRHERESITAALKQAGGKIFGADGRLNFSA